jgi:protein-serine/threonine kinase
MKMLPDAGHGVNLLDGASGGIRFLPYPTPPASSASSYTQKEDGDGAGAKPGSRNGSFAGGPGAGPARSAREVLSHRTRRPTAGLRSLSSIVTTSSVHAAHISNPATAWTTPGSPARGDAPLSAFSSLTSSYSELVRLTESVALAPRPKSTPPHTPRALSSNGTDIAQKPSGLGSNAIQSPPDDKVFSSAQENGAAKADRVPAPSPEAASPPVGPPRGKLSVKIMEARGLRPSLEPYVVCVFEWNEYISKGPKADEPTAEKEAFKGREDLFGGVPIKRSGSDMGRSMAIPMKSRQSSTASLSDQKNFKADRQVTSPKWEHGATL